MHEQIKYKIIFSFVDRRHGYLAVIVAYVDLLQLDHDTNHRNWQVSHTYAFHTLHQL